MSFEQGIQVLKNGSIVAECGPMHLMIQAWSRTGKATDIALQGASESFSYLERVAALRGDLSKPAVLWTNRPSDEIACSMLDSVSCLLDEDLTPMASVAGAIADAVADKIFALGAVKVIVDNGGDIAVRLACGQSARLGFRPQEHYKELSRVIHLDSRYSSWGTATSGAGGRSFTRGIASAVTVVARNSAMADAASTSVANACRIDHENIVQVPAVNLDPDTDIPDIPVTFFIGRLEDEDICRAISRARNKAEFFVQQGFIFGAIIAVGRHQEVTQGLQRSIGISNC